MRAALSSTKSDSLNTAMAGGFRVCGWRFRLRGFQFRDGFSNEE